MRKRQNQDKSPSFGSYLMERRKSLNLTLKDVAEHCGVSINYISLIERGEKTPSDKVLQKLEEVLEFENGKLFSMTNRISPYMINAIFTSEHEGLLDLFSEVLKNKFPEELREQLLKEVESVYIDFLNRHNIK